VAVAGIHKAVAAGIRKAIAAGTDTDNIVVEEAAFAAEQANLMACRNYHKTLTRKQQGCRISDIDTIAAFSSAYPL
jgi:hypothetical protein